MQKMSPNLSFNSLTVSPPNRGAPSRVGSSADGSEVTEAASPRGCTVIARRAAACPRGRPPPSVSPPDYRLILRGRLHRP